MAATRLVEELVARGATATGDHGARRRAASAVQPDPAVRRTRGHAPAGGAHPPRRGVVRRARHRPPPRRPGPRGRARPEGRHARRRHDHRVRRAGARDRQHPDAAADPRPGEDGRLAARVGPRLPLPPRLPAAARRGPDVAGDAGDRARSWSAVGCSASRSPGPSAPAVSTPRSSRAATTCSTSRSAAPAGGILARDLKKLGVAVYTGARAIRLSDGPDGRAALRLDTGFTLDTDLVILTAGGRPSTALARRAGLDVRRGIVVDDRLASVTDPDIYALGDCAEHDHRVTGFVPPAWEQAGVLAGVLTDEPASTTAAGSSPGCGPPAWMSPCSATPSRKCSTAARSSRCPTRCAARTASSSSATDGSSRAPWSATSTGSA